MSDDVWDKQSELEWSDLKECWTDLQSAKSPITLVTDRVSDVKSQLEIACAKTTFELTQFAKQYNDQSLTSEILSALVSKAVGIFMDKWYEGLRSQNTAGLLEIVLERQDLTPDELKSFLRGLPVSFLNKVIESAITSASGIHGLIALEIAHRDHRIPNYTLEQEGRRKFATFYDAKRSKTVKFYLDETFEVVTSG